MPQVPPSPRRPPASLVEFPGAADPGIL